MIASPATWSGTYDLPRSAEPVAISVQVDGRTATVALGAGHTGATVVKLGRGAGRVRFSLPGLPRDVVFDGVANGARIAGSVTQGTLRGTFVLRRGRSGILPLLGVYRSGPDAGVAVVQAPGFAPWLVELPGGATHGIGTALTVGRRLGDTSGDGAIVPDATGITWNGAHYSRVAVRQSEVRVGVDSATLTLPSGGGPYAAATMVHGSGPQTRGEFQVFAAWCELLGIGVLADDKRGVGESGGAYPGEEATSSTIDVLARDAQAEVRFLAGLPQVDPKRVGLFGDSQAGWIIALAAARDPAVRWATAVVGPTVTVGETDLWAQLAGGSQSPPSGTRAAMLAEVRAAGPSGFDPAPSLRALSIPVLWTFGSDDRNVPTELCVERLQALMPGHDFSWVVLPTTHTPIDLPTGLLASLPQSPGFDPGFFPALGDWLRSHGLSS
jgi:pimeloyl-ACP methyl ester carboxylesterase